MLTFAETQSWYHHGAYIIVAGIYELGKYNNRMMMMILLVQVLRLELTLLKFALLSAVAILLPRFYFIPTPNEIQNKAWVSRKSQTQHPPAPTTT